MQPKTHNAPLGTTAHDAIGRFTLPTAVLASGLFAVAVATSAGVVWGLDAEAASRATTRLHEVRNATEMVARAAEQVLEWDGPESLPRLLNQAATTYDLSTCRIRVPGDATIAESGAMGNEVGTIPDVLPETAHRSETIAHAVANLVEPVRAGRHGDLVLEVSANVSSPWNTGLATLGLPIVCGAGVVSMLLAHRVSLARLRKLSAIERALEAARAGTTDAGALIVADSLGEHARAWNTIVGERDTFRAFAAFKEVAGPGAGASSDLSAACDVMTQGILILDERLRVKYANGAAATLLAAGHDDLLGADVRKFIVDGEVVTAFEGVASGKVRQRLSVESSRVGAHAKSGDPGVDRAGSVLRFSARPVRREQNGVVMVVVEDVTQQKVADEARNSFVAQATHELRTPLTNIRLYTDAMIEDGENAEMRVKALNVISSESRRLERIVADMLSVSEIEAGTLKVVKGDVRLDQLLDELKEDYRVQAEDKEIALSFELPPKLPVIQGDRDKLALSLHNLIGNALKYTPAGGKVTVRAVETPGQFLVHVIDNGIGIRQEERELIFDRFYRAKDARVANLTGTGLGLTLARDIARMHGGDILVQSELDKGSTFTLELPSAGDGHASGVSGLAA